MRMNPRDFLDEIGGVPFISERFEHTKLLTAVACLRRNSDSHRDLPLRDYLDPIVARDIYQESFLHLQKQHAEALGSEFEDMVRCSITRVCEIAPTWVNYFRIPMCYFLLVDGRTSMTSAAIPQTIYFGREVFSSRVGLDEALVHEHAHVWLDFICEVFSLQLEEAPCDYILPSGTKGKTLQGVLLAAHFAASCLVYYKNPRLNKDAFVLSRINSLQHYLEGCLELVLARPVLTEMGRFVYEELQLFFEKSSQLSFEGA